MGFKSVFEVNFGEDCREDSAGIIMLNDIRGIRRTCTLRVASLYVTLGDMCCMNCCSWLGCCMLVRLWPKLISMTPAEKDA